MRRLSVLLVVAGLLLAACGGDDAGSDTSVPAANGDAGAADDVVATVASSDIGVGNERLLIGISERSGTRLGSPDEALTIEVAPEGDPGAVQSADGAWTWIVPDVTGLYRAVFEFDQPGFWQATVTPEGGDPLETVLFEVKEDTSAPGLGAAAPVAPTPTLDDLPLDELTTDPEPDERFYEMSLEEALESGRSTVLVFSTPAYCQTSSCGPLLDHVKEIAPDHPDVNFVHVEVYTGLQDPDFQPDAAHLAPAVTAEWYALPSEPWVFLIDREGTVVGRYEGVMDPAELENALAP